MKNHMEKHMDNSIKTGSILRFTRALLCRGLLRSDTIPGSSYYIAITGLVTRRDCWGLFRLRMRSLGPILGIT